MGFVPYRQNRTFLRVDAEPAGGTPTGAGLWFRSRILGGDMGGVTNAFESGASLLGENTVGDSVGLSIDQPGLYEFSAHYETNLTAGHFELRICGSESSPTEEIIFGDYLFEASSSGIVVIAPVLIPITTDWLNETDPAYHRFCPWFRNATSVSLSVSAGIMNYSYLGPID